MKTSHTRNRWEPIDLAWMAGLLEGEGHFGKWSKTTKNGLYTYPVYRIGCNLTDLDVLQRLHQLAGVGRLSGQQTPQKPQHSPFWRWMVNKKADVYALCVALLPYMGERRSARLREIIASYESRPSKAWRHGTRHGYEKGCRCASCKAAHAAHHRQRRERRRQREALSASAS